jgi:acyl carrier protein
MENTKEILKVFILKEFLPGEDPDELKDSTPLITGGILDSLATLRLVSFIEEQFNIELQSYETGVDYLNSIGDIATLIHSKLS